MLLGQTSNFLLSTLEEVRNGRFNIFFSCLHTTDWFQDMQAVQLSHHFKSSLKLIDLLAILKWNPNNLYRTIFSYI